MKRNIKLFTTLLVITFVAVPVFSQPRPGERDRNPNQGREMLRELPPEVVSEAHLAVFDEYLDLSESQENQIKAVDEKFALKGKELREEKIDRRKKMVFAKELREDHQKAIHEILTKEQYSIYLDKKEAIQYDIRQRLKDHPKGDN